MNHPPLTIRSRIARLTGRMECTLRPGLAQRRGGPFNGQEFRRECYRDLLQKFKFSSIIETGCYRGITTSLFSQSGAPVYSIETNPRYAAYSHARFRRTSHVHVIEGDSRLRLDELAHNAAVPRENVFFYLDAHWLNDLPLAEELDIIMEHWRDSVIMIDDFKVPGSGYTYDDYGPGKALTEEYLQPFLDRGLRLFYPSEPAASETGARRGCAVLVDGDKGNRRLEACKYLVLAESMATTSAA